MTRLRPNIIVTGTPSVGKTTHCELLAQNTGLKHLPINLLVKQRSCHHGWDEEYQSWIIDDDKLLDSLEDEVPLGGYIIDWHVCDVFPKSWIDLVVVLRTDSTKLYDRLKSRQYAENKLQENLDSEIMQVVLEEARESYDYQIVVELVSNRTEDVEANVNRIEEWITNWSKNGVED